MKLIDAEALERDGWMMHRTFHKDTHTMVYETKKPSDFPTIEPERKAEKMVKILADVLDGCPLTQPCDRLWKPEGWCKEHCKAGQGEPDAECWLKYAEVKADE